MKPSILPSLVCFLAASCFIATAKEAVLNYQFTADQTNVYSVEISVQSESGTEVTTGNVFIVTKEVTTNSAKITCWSTMTPQIRRRPMMWGGGFGGPGFYPGMMGNFFPNDCEIELDDRGQELRDGGDYVLAAPLGKLVQSIFEPLPGKENEKATVSTVAVQDDPLWLGPAENFANSRMNGQPYFNNGFGFNQRNAPGLLYVSRRNSIHFKKGDDDAAVEWHKHGEFESFLKNGAVPRMSATSESDFSFDRSAGLLTQVTTTSEITSETENSSRKATVSFKCHLLTGDELVAALTPPPPVAPRKLSRADLSNLTDELKSNDPETRKQAIRGMNGTEIEAPSDELVDLVASMALDQDMSIRISCANFLADHATTNQTPVLLKMLKNQDWPTRQGATKALIRLHDPQAIEPLVDQIARNGNMGGQDLNNAIISFGPAAEKAVLGLFKEKNTETRRQACNILQQIGTSLSVPTLQTMAGDSDQSLSQAATEALRNINLRQ